MTTEGEGKLMHLLSRLVFYYFNWKYLLKIFAIKKLTLYL